MNEKVINKALYDVLRAMMPIECKVIAADQNEPRPMRPYVTWKVTGGPMREGWDAEEYLEEDEESGLSYGGSRTIVVSLNFYGERALEGLARVQSRLQWETNRAILSAKNLVFVSDSGVRDLSQLLETQTETRSQMDVTMRFTALDVDESVGVIERVEITGEDLLEQDIEIVIDPEEGN